MTDIELFLTVLLVMENVAILLVGIFGNESRSDRDLLAEELEAAMRRKHSRDVT